MSALVRTFDDQPRRSARDAWHDAAAALERIAAFGLAFEHGAVFGRAVPADGGWTYERSPALRALLDAAEATGFMLPAPEDVDLDRLAAEVPFADADQARLALSALLRRERRAPGALAEPVARGVVGALFRRLDELRASEGPRSFTASRGGGRPDSFEGARRWPHVALATSGLSAHPAPTILAAPRVSGAGDAVRGHLARPGADVGDMTAILADLLIGLATWDPSPRLGDARFLVLAVEAGEAPSFVQVLSDPTQHGLLIEVDSGFFEPEGAWRATAEQRARAKRWGFSDGTRSNFAKAAFVGGFDDAARLARELVAVLSDLCGWARGEPIELVVHRGLGDVAVHASLTPSETEELLRRSGVGARVGQATTEEAPGDEDVAVVRSATRGVAFAAVLSERIGGPLARYRHLRFAARFRGQFPPAVAERFNAETSAGRATRDGKALVISLDVPLEGGVTESALRAAISRFALLAQAARLFVARCHLRPSKLGVLRAAHFKAKVQELERRLMRVVTPGRVEDVVQELAELRGEAGLPIASAINAEIRRIVKDHQDWTWVKDLMCPGGVDAAELVSVLSVLGGPVLHALSDGNAEIEHPCRGMRVVVDPRRVRQVSFATCDDHALQATLRLREEDGERRFVVTADDVGFTPLVGEDIELLGTRVPVRPPAAMVTTGEVEQRLVSIERGLLSAQLDRVLLGCGEIVACVLGARAAGLDLPSLERRLGAVLASLRLRGELRLGDPRPATR